MTNDAHLKIVLMTGTITNMMQRPVGCENIPTVDNGRQLMIYDRAGIGRELCDKFVSVCNRNPPLSTKAFVHSIYETGHHDLVSAGIVADTFREKHPREWTKKALIT